MARILVTNEVAVSVDTEAVAHRKHIALRHAVRFAPQRDGHGSRQPDGLWPGRSPLLCDEGSIVRLRVIGGRTWLGEATRWIARAAEQRLRLAAKLSFACAVKDVLPQGLVSNVRTVLEQLG